MASVDHCTAQELGTFIDGSPSPFHATAAVAALLEDAGFSELAETDQWTGSAQNGFIRRGGSLVAWAQSHGPDPLSGFRIIGAHTDSPNLRIKPRPDSGNAGVSQLGVEVYGSALLNSWLDRDLGISGRVAVAGEGITQHLVRIDEPVLRVPQLAIHLDRDVNDVGLKLNRQKHMAPIWRDGPSDLGHFASWLAERIRVEEDQIRGWDLMAHDLTPSSLMGADEAFLAAPRIDNLASCHAGTVALLAAEPSASTLVLCLFDHEEVGSVSATGAAGALLPGVLSRIHRLGGGKPEDLPRSLAASACISADGAHATHPNYVDRHEPDHRIQLNGGPVIKRNSNARYATDAAGQALAEEACRAAEVPFQLFVNRTDLACGSTIGPVTAAQLGVTTVDMGIAQLSMHSARELCGAADPPRLAGALRAFYCL
ncbi:MAG: M18 family aminopeptidase [Acidimicrobiales bacterium]